MWDSKRGTNKTYDHDKVLLEMDKHYLNQGLLLPWLLEMRNIGYITFPVIDRSGKEFKCDSGPDKIRITVENNTTEYPPHARNMPWIVVNDKPMMANIKSMLITSDGIKFIESGKIKKKKT